ncbi:MAG: SGNH/GDSL hydrolase family protein [Oscillospiraceae bacterium]|nr:SGNH/GDSL hydrolase family protein [Oscillospiraceae bacterium]
MAKRILFQGDSITDCGRNREDITSTGVGYPLLVKAKMGFEHPGEYEFINMGISGNRIVDVYARIRRDLINLKPDYMSILIGVNDVWHELGGRHDGVDAEKFERIYDMLITEVKQALPDLKIMILEPFVLEGSASVPTETEPGRWDDFRTEVPLRAAAAKRIAEKHGLVYIPLQDKLDEACKLAPPSYWLRDGVHPTPMGHQLIMNEWLKAFETL